MHEMNRKQKRKGGGGEERLRNQRIGVCVWGGGDVLLSNDKSCRKKDRVSPGLKERGKKAGHHIAAIKRKAGVDAGRKRGGGGGKRLENICSGVVRD